MIQAGAATRVITNSLGSWVQAAGVTKRAEAVRDDLEANALYLNKDSSEILLVGCDLAALETGTVAHIRAAMAAASGVAERAIILSGTHTHGGPSVIHTNPRIPVDTTYLDRLKHWLCDLASEARTSARPARLGWGAGTSKVGYNRRCCWADGSHSMHGSTAQEGFTGLEGPDDPQHVALRVTDLAGRTMVVLHHNTSHPTTFYGAGVYSSDFPGEARRILRETFGPIPVLFLNGAFGDISMQRQPRRSDASYDREDSMLLLGRKLARATLRLLEDVEMHEDLPVRHTCVDLPLAVRLPTTERLTRAAATLEEFREGKDIKGIEAALAMGVVELQERFGPDPVDSLPIHAVRLGDLGIATQPCELFCQFGLDIKRRSPARKTIVVSVADGYGGYCPTVYGILGGGYSGDPTSWTRLQGEAGYKIVDCASRLLWELWR